MNAPKEWIDAAERITPGFEVPGDPYLGVTGDFDGMGISCGALQWNIGKASLQPMVKAVGRDVVAREMPEFGEDMWEVCDMTVAKGLKVVRSWQSGTKLRAKPKIELKALMGSAEMRSEQRKGIEFKAHIAFDRATVWAEDRDRTQASKRLFCWFFDIVTQNGGMETVTPKSVAEFMEFNKPDKVDDLICDFLKTKVGSSGHVSDAKKKREALAGQGRGRSAGNFMHELSACRNSRSSLAPCGA